jgi:WD40 repeat protein
MRGHSVSPVVFHPSVPYLATGCGDETAKMWFLNADSAPTCVFTLRVTQRRYFLGLLSSVFADLSATVTFNRVFDGINHRNAKIVR